MDEYDMFGNMENANRLNIIHIKLIKRAKKKKNLHIKHRILICQKTAGKLISHKYRLRK